MPITQVPKEWHFYLNLPDPEDNSEVEGEWSVKIDDSISYAGTEYAFPEVIKFKARGYRTRPDFYVQLQITAEAITACSRCLEHARVAINGQFSYLYCLASRMEKKGDDAGKDESIVKVKSLKSNLDITSQAWESLILLLPEKIVCSENCKGLCPECGINLNYGECTCSREKIDPRMAALKNLYDDSDETQS